MDSVFWRGVWTASRSDYGVGGGARRLYNPGREARRAPCWLAAARVTIRGVTIGWAGVLVLPPGFYNNRDLGSAKKTKSRQTPKNFSRLARFYYCAHTLNHGDAPGYHYVDPDTDPELY